MDIVTVEVEVVKSWVSGPLRRYGVEVLATLATRSAANTS
jgi:hypothetical protein